MQTVTRRGFVQAAACGAALAGMTAAAQPAWAEIATEDTAWDAEYDVVVLGLGGAGANAAVAAYEEGASVLVCEKAPEGEEPCCTKVAGQCVMATDDPDQLYTYLSQLMGKFDNWDEDALRAFCEGCAENFDWMCGPMGGDPEVVYPETNPADVYEWERIVHYEWAPTQHHWGDWYEAESAWGIDRPGYVYIWHEFPEIPESMHCMMLFTTGTRFDAGYYNLCMQAVSSRADDEKLTLWKGCPGKRLITDAAGAVIGAVVEKDGVELRVKANGGVCLCTGGFEANADMMSDYTQIPTVNLQGGTMNTGDGILMAQSVGARLWHMSNVSGFMWSYKNPELTTCTSLALNWNPRGIFAGLSGKRFQNETAANRHGRIDVGGRWISTPMPIPTYFICDADQIGEPIIPKFSEGNADEIASGQIIEAATIEELSQKIRDLGEAPDFNANGELDSALEKYNRHCHANDGAGEEDDFGRTCTVPVETGPFYAVKIGPTMYNTQGGPRRNGQAQVVGVDGLPIEGLFVGGEMGSVFADMYNGGGNLGETMVFGRLAGRNAAKRAQGTFESAAEPVKTHREVLAEQAQGETGDAAAFALAGDYTDGTYEGTGQGYGGKIGLSVTVEGGRVVSVEVLESSETATIGELALPVYCEQAASADTLDEIDVASGASNTLRGFKAAVEDALAQA